MAYRYDDRPTRGGYVRKNPYTWEYGRERDSERGMVDRASDEVSSWFGDDQAARRRRQDEARDDRYDARNDREEAWRERRDRGAMRGPRQAIGQPTGSTRVHEVMTRNVVAVRPEDPVSHAARIMRDEDCGALPVVDRYGRAIGMITDRDITCRLVAEERNTRMARVGDCMTDEVFACHAGSSLDECMETMSSHQVRRLPIVDDRDRLVGIVSQGDLARYAGINRAPGARHAVADVVCAISEPTDEPYH
jgi:CBS-domain-containing membrane protein